MAARTDESKVKLPAFHRYVIKFDYKTLSGDTRLNLTIRPKATMLDETVSFGFETHQAQGRGEPAPTRDTSM